jgi:hypothetical protein
MVEKEETVKTFKDLTSAEKLRLVIRYKAWYDSCMRGTPLQSQMFTGAAGFVHNEILKLPQTTDEEVRFVETYSTWHVSCLEGKPHFDEETMDIVKKVRAMFLSSDGRNVNPEFG